MSAEENKAAVRRLNEAVNKGDFSVLPELFAPDYVFHMTPEIKGLEALKEYFANQRNAFPDYREKIEYILAEGDLVAVFYTISGTFKGEMAGMAPTGKSYSQPICVLARFRDGKQVEAWGYMDTLAIYRQLGIPIPAE